MWAVFYISVFITLRKQIVVKLLKREARVTKEETFTRGGGLECIAFVNKEFFALLRFSPIKCLKRSLSTNDGNSTVRSEVRNL